MRECNGGGSREGKERLQDEPVHAPGWSVCGCFAYVCVPLCVFVCMVYVGMDDVCFCAPHMLCVCVYNV